MAEVLAASLAFPAVLFTGVLALAMIYWLFVILGALDLDLLGGAEDAAMPDLDAGIDGVAKGALEGAVKGSLEGAAKGALEGAVKGSLEGAAKGVAEGIADADGAGEEGGGLAALFAALHLNRAPATVVLTLLAAFGWVSSVVGLMTLSPLWAQWGLPPWSLKLLLLVLAVAVALPLTSIVVRPLGPFFATRGAKTRSDLLGRECVISTGRVDERFGQATLADGGAGLILDVRCDTPGALRQGDRALLVSWDPEREAFEVEPIAPMLDDRRKKPAGAAAAPAAPDPAPEGEGEGEGEAEAGDASAGRSRGRAG